MKHSLYKICSQIMILSLMLSTACTHKRDSLMGDTELSSGNEQALDVTSSESSPEFGATSEPTSESTESTPPAEDLAASSSDSSTAPSEDLSATSDTSASLLPESSTSEAAGDSLATPAEQNDLSSLGGDLATTETTQPELVIPPTETVELTTPSGDSLASTETLGSESAVLPDATVAANPDTLPAPAPETAEAPTPQEAKPVVATKAATVPTQAIKKGKQLLNRYYFVRTGDSAESLSKLFYGSTDHEKELITWNGFSKSWKAGKLVFFVSADQPDDTEMSSFYEEQGINTETYTVKNGDQLSTIAKDKYGNVMSWKEIAVLNHLSNPDQIKTGQQLTLLPTQMTSIHAKPAAVTAQLPPVKSAEPEVKVLTEEDQEQLAFEAMDKEAEVAGHKLPAPGTQMDKAKETHMAALEVAQPDSTNLTALALGGGFALLALFLFLVRRSRSRARAEFME